MGKNKAQRTKNNAKPSNSCRSAELLGTAMPNFVGFSAVKDGGYVPVLPGLSISALNEVDVNTIDPNFQLVLKKMSKKDATTKFKALGEFADLCKDSPLSSVEAVIPFWPRHYSTLSIDIDHRVREAAQFAHAALVKKVGRSIALYLKQLAGPWFTSQFDTYPPAASAATNSFQATFPQKKYVDAIVHCQDEILAYICDNIIVQTPESLNVNKSTIDKDLDKERKIEMEKELEAKYQRLLICSLQGYCCYFKKVPQQQIEKTEKIHKQILNNAKFWKLAKYESSSMIKMAFYNVLASIIENSKDLLKDEKKRTMTAIMNSLDESEPGILSAVWESMLVALDKIEDWYHVVSVEKLVLPKLWRVLRSGGQGCASVVYPSLLPLISQFPKLNIDNKRNLFINFFDNMRQGFTVKAVQMSRSEMTAITKSFVECLRYAVLLNHDDVELCELLLKEQLIPVLESAIKEYSLIKGILFNEVTQLIRYWSKNRDGEYKSYTQLVQKFWCELESLFERLVDSTNESFDRSTLSNIQDAQVKLLVNMKSSTDYVRQNVRVKFADTESIDEAVPIKFAVTVDEDPQFREELNCLVNKLCISYFKNIDNINLSHSIEYLNRIVVNFESKSLFMTMAKAHRNDEDLLEFYNNSLKHWLVEKNIDQIAVVQLIFTILKYMNDQDQETVLKSLTKLDDKQVCNSAIICALTDKNRNHKAIKSWREGCHVTKHIKEVAKKLIIEEYENSDADLLFMAFKSSDGDFSINEEAINSVIKMFCDYLDKSEGQLSEFIVNLTSDLLELSWNYKTITSGSVELQKKLFELITRDRLSIELKQSIQDKCINGFEVLHDKLPNNQLVDIQKDCMRIIYDKLYSRSEGTIDEIVEIAACFIETSCNHDYQDTLSLLIEFNCSEKILYNQWFPQATNLILNAELITGNFHLSNPLRSLPLNREFAIILPENEELPQRITHCLRWALFNARLFNKFLSNFDEDDMNDEIDSSIKDCLSEFPQILNSILLVTSLGYLYCNHFKSAKDYFSVQTMVQFLENECDELRECVPKYIWNAIIAKSMDVDTYWMEFGSIFSQFLRYDSNSADHLLEVKSRGEEILKNYLEINDPTIVQHLNAVVLARNLLDDEKYQSICSEVLVRMIKRHESDKDYLLFNRDIRSINWSDCYLPLEVIRLFTKFVTKIPEKMSAGMWDATIIFLASWQLSLAKSKHNHGDLKIRSLIVAVCELYCAVQELMTRQQINREMELPEKLLDEWLNVFSDDANREMARIWMYFGEVFNEKTDYLTQNIVITRLNSVIQLIDGNTFFQSYSGYTSISVDPNDIIKFALKLITSPVAGLQSTAYYAINRLLPKLVEQDMRLIELENFDAKNLNIRRFEETLMNLQKTVDGVLMDFEACDDVNYAIRPFTDAFTYTYAYLLAWSCILDMCGHAPAVLRFHYGEMLKDQLFPSLINNIFRLIPVDVLDTTRSSAAPHIVELFRKRPAFDFNNCLIECNLGHIVCWIYINCLRHLPVLMRHWWSTTDSRVSNIVEKLTTLYVSPILCQEELQNDKLKDVENMEIKVYPVAREVVALYTMDDTKLDLSMILPKNHPLGQVVVEPGKHVGAVANWKNCHMQLSIFLTHENGSLWDGLMMWKKNLDKKFAGVEECYICFSIFHISTYQIPKLSCKTCRKKFHAPCLYKWFSTSQKSTCPICRNIF